MTDSLKQNVRVSYENDNVNNIQKYQSSQEAHLTWIITIKFDKFKEIFFIFYKTVFAVEVKGDNIVDMIDRKHLFVYQLVRHNQSV